eukprot:1443555-Alexandrium_andersonii.AAC.1
MADAPIILACPTGVLQVLSKSGCATPIEVSFADQRYDIFTGGSRRSYWTPTARSSLPSARRGQDLRGERVRLYIHRGGR